MNEFIEKLIGRLEERCDVIITQNQENFPFSNVIKTLPIYEKDETTNITIREAIEIVNQLAEEYKNQNNDQDLTIVESLPSLYPMMQSFEVEAIYRVVERGKYSDGWISCSKRLPEKSGRYIVTIKNATRATTLHYFEGSWHDGISQHYEVIAWQPLPEPFKPKGE